MAINIDKSGINLALGEDVKKYIDKKIGHLSYLVPRAARKSMRIEVKIREANNKDGNKYVCEAIIHLPNAQVIAKESTINMFAAVDIVEAKLKNQLHAYKEEHIAHLSERRRTVLKRLRSRFFSQSDGQE
jgi:ribosomal subunit interface protein